MSAADAWFICRIGFIETFRAVALAAGPRAAAPIRAEWPAFGIVEVDQALVERAADLAVKRKLRSVDSMHLAAALTLPVRDLHLATWDYRLHAAAKVEGLHVFPTSLP